MNSFADGQDVSIVSFKMTRVDRNIFYYDEFASLDVVIGECRFEARLSLCGRLRLPEGAYISDDLHQRATELAKQKAMSELTKAWWGRARASGTVHRIRAVAPCEQEA